MRSGVPVVSLPVKGGLSEDELKRRMAVWRARAESARDPLERAANTRLAEEYRSLLERLLAQASPNPLGTGD